MRKNKQILSTLLALVLCLGLCAPALAYDAGKPGTRNVVSAGGGHTAAVDSGGSLWTWGYNAFGQLGNGSKTDSAVPVKVLDGVVSVSCGEDHTAAIKTDGTLWMWGRNYYGQLGTGTTADSATPVKVLDNVAAVVCGEDRTAALKTDGTLWAWGSGFQSGSQSALTPVKAMDNVIAISCEEEYVVFVEADGTPVRWNGRGYSGLEDGKVIASGGGSHVASIATDGSLWTSGLYNECGQLGNGSTEGGVTSFKVMEGVAAVSCGTNYTAAIKTDGTLWTWGCCLYGKLGNNNQWNDTGVNGHTNQTLPVKVLDGAAAVSCGRDHVIAVKTDGTLWTWGGNYNGQLGNGGTGNETDVEGKPIQSVPKQITLGGGVSAATPSTPTAPSTPSTPAPTPAGTQPGTSSGAKNNPDDIIQIYLNNKNVWLESDSDEVYGDVYTYTLIDLEGDGVPELVSTTMAGGSGNPYGSGFFKVDVNARKVSVMQNVPEDLRDGLKNVKIYRDQQSGQLLYYAESSNNMGWDYASEQGYFFYMSGGALTARRLWGYSRTPEGESYRYYDGSGNPVEVSESSYEQHRKTYLSQYTLLAESLPTYSVDTMAGGKNSSVTATVLRKLYDQLYQSIRVTSAAPAPTVVLSPQKLSVNGVNVNCEKYNIDGSNYFKLRDLAYLLRDTGSRFSVDFDAARSTIVVRTGAAYTPAGGELVTGADKSSSAVASAQSIEINGAKVELTAYNIGGNNFFKLRDLGTALGFEVGYDQAANTATVRSAQK